MKFAFSSVMILASFSAVLSQATSSTSAAPSASTSASSSSMAADSDSMSMSSAAAPTATCMLVSGDPMAQPYGCVPGATTVTPPYDSASLASFQVGKYKPAKSAEPISSVATDMAKTVTQLYPTLTVSFSDIVQEYVSVLSASATNFTRDGAVGSVQIPAAASMLAMVFVAIAAGGAFIL